MKRYLTYLPAKFLLYALIGIGFPLYFLLALIFVLTDSLAAYLEAQ